MSNESDRDIVHAVANDGRTLQQTRAPYSTAVSVQVPRKLDDVRRRLLEEARIGGEMFFYGWGAGKDHIEGPSIHLAMAAARCWGNCAVFPEPVQDGGDAWIFTTAFVDLETGFTLQRQFRQSKRSIVHGKHDAERKDDIRFQIGQSKASRNVVVNALPKTIINEAMREAQKGVRDRLEKWINGYDNAHGKGKGLAAAQDHALEALKRQGIDEERVLAKMSRPTKVALTLDDLILLKGDVVALEEGTDRIESLYPDPDAENGGDEVMDHLDGDEPRPEPGSPTPDQPKGGKKGSKRKSGKSTQEDLPNSTGKDEGTTQGASDGSQDEKPINITKEDLKEIEKGVEGPEVQEAALEMKARYNRLGEDPEALDKYEPIWGWIEDGAGDGGVRVVNAIRAYYQALAKPPQ